MSKNSVIIYSGGMDSTTLLYEKQKDIALAISFNYGSKHNDKEYEFAKVHTKLLGIEHIRIDLTETIGHFKSDLLKSGGTIPEGHYADDTMSKTVVPFRNGIMLSIASGIANSKGLKSVLVANHFGDDAQYPDCRENFVKPMRTAIFNGTGYSVFLDAPYTKITKADIAKLGDSLSIDWSTTWSCYKGGEHHCGKCGTCVERIWALQNSTDNTIYEDYNYAVDALKAKGEWE